MILPAVAENGLQILDVHIVACKNASHGADEAWPVLAVRSHNIGLAGTLCAPGALRGLADEDADVMSLAAQGFLEALLQEGHGQIVRHVNNENGRKFGAENGLGDLQDIALVVA